MPHMHLTNSIEIVLSAISANFIAQFYKFIVFILVNKQINFKRLFQTGGMPSSHSAFMMAMATSTGMITGFNSSEFAVALTIALVVMYDAAGLRRAVGRQASVLNQIVAEIFSEHPHLSSQKFRELLGHTPIEVFVGAVLGIAVAGCIHRL
ncbi:MAG: divergent PAP2 family protein [Candidatus Melainabacteria bacterium]|nr:divergent PAP2 family protein [Candidatus Melainabacteria bacterium]